MRAGPCLRGVGGRRPPGPFRLSVIRGRSVVFQGETSTAAIAGSRWLDWLGRAMAFERGCFLMTGTGIVPPESFHRLAAGDEVSITIEGIGVLAVGRA